MRNVSKLRAPAAGLIVLLTAAACSDGTVVFGGKRDRQNPDTITVRGDIRDWNPQIAGADIVVFVFTDLSDPPGDFKTYVKQRAVAVSTDEEPLEFEVSQIESGTLTVVFLQDHASDPDGTIDIAEDPANSDPIAILEDPDKVLRDVRSGEAIRIDEVDIDFNTGKADALNIKSVREPPTDPGVDEEE